MKQTNKTKFSREIIQTLGIKPRSRCSTFMNSNVEIFIIRITCNSIIFNKAMHMKYTKLMAKKPTRTSEIENSPTDGNDNDMSLIVRTRICVFNYT